jgi:hypothetical protein
MEAEMFEELFFCCDEDVTARSAADLCHGLAGQLGSRAIALQETGTQIRLVDFGLTLSLVYESDGTLIGAVVVLPRAVDLNHVGQLCGAFRELGWTF